jgi:hypothetical protein
MNKLKATAIAAIATLGVAAPAVIPSVASANGTTSLVARQWSQQIHNNIRLAGMRVVATTFRCASAGGGYYNCYGTYTVSYHGATEKFGGYVKVTPTRWYSVGKGIPLD